MPWYWWLPKICVVAVCTVTVSLRQKIKRGPKKPPAGAKHSLPSTAAELTTR